MTQDEFITCLLEAAPSIAPAWEEHLKFWGGEAAGKYNDVAVVAHHLVNSYQAGSTDELPQVFAVLERSLENPDDELRNLAIVGLIEDIQNIASWHMGYEVFAPYLGPKSKTEWDALIAWYS